MKIWDNSYSGPYNYFSPYSPIRPNPKPIKLPLPLTLTLIHSSPSLQPPPPSLPCTAAASSFFLPSTASSRPPYSHRFHRPCLSPARRTPRRLRAAWPGSNAALAKPDAPPAPAQQPVAARARALRGRRIEEAWLLASSPGGSTDSSSLSRGRSSRYLCSGRTAAG